MWTSDRHASPLSRRRLLRAGGIGLAGLLAGCRGDEPAESSTTVGQPTDTAGTPTPTGTPSPAAVHVHTDYDYDRWPYLWESELVPAFEAETGTDVRVHYADTAENSLTHLLKFHEPPDSHTSQFWTVVPLWERAQGASTGGDRFSLSFEPATAIVRRAADRHGPLVVEPYAADGEYWQVPHGYMASTFTYRADVYDELGLDVPTSFRAVLDNARAIDESDLAVRGYAVPASGSGKSGLEFRAYLARMGVSPLGLRWRDADARDRLELHFPEREVTTLLAFFRDLAQYSPDPTQIGWSESIDQWQAGRYAQQLGLNVQAAGYAARAAGQDDGSTPVATETDIAPLPYWKAGGVGRTDSWAYRPQLDGHTIFRDGGNTAGARQWFDWLYADRTDRTAGLYTAPPFQYLPAFDGIRTHERYRSHPPFDAYPHLLEQVDFVRNTIVADHYGTVEAADLADPIALKVARLGRYGELIERVVTGKNSPQEAYEWGRTHLERALEDARDRAGH